MSDRFWLTGEVRYTQDKRAALDLQKFAISPAITTPAAVTGLPPIPCLPNTPTPGARLPGTLCPLINQTPGFYDSRVTFNRVTWKAGIEVDLGVQSARFVPPGRVGCPVTAPNAQGLVTIDCSGRPLIRSPKWSGNVGLTQVFDLSGGGNVTFDADLSFAGKRFINADFTTSQLAKGYTNISASLTYNAPNDRWFVGGFVRNLTNAEIYTGGGGHQAAFVSGRNTSNIAPPRTWGGRIGVKF